MSSPFNTTNLTVHTNFIQTSSNFHSCDQFISCKFARRVEIQQVETQKIKRDRFFSVQSIGWSAHYSSHFIFNEAFTGLSAAQLRDRSSLIFICRKHRQSSSAKLRGNSLKYEKGREICVWDKLCVAIRKYVRVWSRLTPWLLWAPIGA